MFLPSRGRFLFLLLLPLLSPFYSFATSDNNVRVDRFHWMKQETAHFDVYYDSSTERLAPSMAHLLEKAWTEVGRKLNYQVPGRTPFFFFSNHNEFEQNNIVPVGEGTGGVTEAYKNRFLIFNDGSQRWLSHVIPHEFTHVIQFNILFGGWWKSVRLLKSPFYPLWMMEGMAEYGGGEPDEPTGDMVVRDSVAYNKILPLAELQGFGHLKPNQVTPAYKTGEAAMHFLVDEYGVDKIQKFLWVMKDYFDVSSALQELINLDLDRFDFRFQEWLHDKYAVFLRTAKPPAVYGKQRTVSDGLPQSNQAPVVSPDGRTLYYLSDKTGMDQIYSTDLITNETTVLVDLKWFKLENIHASGRALSVSHDGTWLAFAGEKRQRDYLYLFNLKKKQLKKIKVPFDEIRSPVFSPVKDELVCVGMKRGLNDLYLLSRKGAVLARLTDSPQDERDPVFSPDGARVVFSAEVQSETEPFPSSDLFEVSLASPSLRHLTHLEGAETEPWILPDGSVVFVRDQNDKGDLGFNLYQLTSSTNPVQMTELIGGAFSPFYSAANDALYFVAYNDGEKHIYESPDFMRKKAAGPMALSSTGFSGAVVVSSTESVPASSGTFSSNRSRDFGWGDPPLNPKNEAMAQMRLQWPEVNGSSLFQGVARPYRFTSSTDLFLPFFYYSTLDGFVVADIWQYSELLGNHQFQQQMQYASGNDYIDLAMFYTYARFWPQFTVGFQTSRYYRDFDRNEQRREVDAIGLMTLPLDRINAVQVGVGGTQRRDSFLDDSQPDNHFFDRYWTAGFSHDTVTGRYLVATRGRRLSFTVQEGNDRWGGDQKYNTRLLEGVQYLPLPRESTIASRFLFGQSSGRNPQVFRLGGVDRIRGLSGDSDANKKENVALGSAEARIRLRYLNTRTKYLFPDFFFKAAYLVLFDDYGYGWDSSAERKQYTVSRGDNAVGAGLSWPTFILQTYEINFTVHWAKRTTDGVEIWYITLGPTF